MVASRMHSPEKESPVIRWLTLLLLLTALLSAPALAADLDGTLKKIKRTKTITLGYQESARPFSFANAEGKPAGYSVDLCALVAAGVGKQLGLPELQLQWVKVWVENRTPAVARGTIDLECSTTTTALSRYELVDFSLLTFIDGASLLVTDVSGIQGVSNLEGKRVALIRGTTTETQLTAALRKRNVTATIVMVQDHAAGVAALDEGTADAYASDRVILTGIGRTAKHPEKLSLLGEFFSYEPYGLMLRRDDAGFRLSVNRTLAQLYRSREIVPIFEKWFADMSTAGPIIAAMYLINGLPEWSGSRPACRCRFQPHSDGAKARSGRGSVPGPGASRQPDPGRPDREPRRPTAHVIALAFDRRQAHRITQQERNHGRDGRAGRGRTGAGSFDRRFQPRGDRHLPRPHQDRSAWCRRAVRRWRTPLHHPQRQSPMAYSR